MSAIFDKIKKDNIQQRKGKNPISTETSFLISNINAAVKSKTKNGSTPEVDDTLVIGEIRSYIKKINQTIELSEGKVDQSKIDELKSNIEFMKTYLPPEISEESIKIDIEAAFDQFGDRSPKVMGKIMGLLKGKYGDAFDGAKVSALIKQMI